MSVARSVSYNPTAFQLIKRALTKANVITPYDEPAAEDIALGMQSLNEIVATWRVDPSLHVWAIEEAILFTQPRQNRYVLGPGSTDHAADVLDYVQTSIAVAASAGETIISVVSATGIADGDKCGITLDTGFVFWTTVSGSPSGNDVVLADALTSAVPKDARVVAYTEDLIKPLKIPAARLHRTDTLMDAPDLHELSHLDYQRLPQKNSEGSPSSYYFQPRREDAFLYVWSVPTEAHQCVKFTWHRPLFNFTDPSQTVDAPAEWIGALQAYLTAEVAADYELQPGEVQNFFNIAGAKLGVLKQHDREQSSVRFGVKKRWR